MRRRFVLCTPLLLAPFLLVASGEPGCSSNSAKAVGLGTGCSLNSDCNNPLVCVFGLCHEACAQTRDCPAGQTCVASGTVNVCTLPGESACTDAGTCTIDTLSCDPQTQKCVNPCTTAGCSVSGQVCVNDLCTDVAEGGVVDASGGDSSMPPGDSSSGSDGEGGSLMESGPPTDAGPLGFFASNVPPSAIPAVPADAGDAGTIISTSCSSGNSGCPFGAPTAIMQNDGSHADLYVVDGLLVDTTQQITFQGPIPVIIVSLGPVYVDGTISVASDFFSPGPGGFPPATPGPGAGQNGVGAYSNSAGGGGGYCGPGGAGINEGTAGAPGGTTYGNATITPLLGGSAGGTIGGGGAVGGAGGGAIQIVSSVSISIGAEGVIAAGGGGAESGALSGGGAGGAILLEAPTVSVSGTLAANGGGGGSGGANALDSAQPATGGLDNSSVVVGGSGSAGTTINGGNGIMNPQSSQGGGGGGAGRIRINTSSGSASITTGVAVISPDPSTACFSQGKTGG
jgi:hypothetical protein